MSQIEKMFKVMMEKENFQGIYEIKEPFFPFNTAAETVIRLERAISTQMYYESVYVRSTLDFVNVRVRLVTFPLIAGLGVEQNV